MRKTKLQHLPFWTEIMKFTIFDKIWMNISKRSEIWMKLVILEVMKNDLLDKIFLVSLIMLVAQYKKALLSFQ